MKRKTIFITGASSGFGLLAAKELLKRDHHVIAGLRGGLERFQGLLPEELRSLTTYDAVDLHMEKPETFSRVRDLLTVKYSGRLDALVNNAGFGLMGPVEMAADEELRYQMDVNFFGPVGLTQVLLPHLRQAEKPRIINVSSIAGLVSFPYYGCYNASKFALNGWTEALAYEVADQGVQVALVEPGGFRTDFVNRSLKFGSREVEGLYRPDVENFKTTLDRKANEVNADPMVVARKIASLCERDRIGLHNIVGTDARAMWFLKRILPLSWVAKITRKIFRQMLIRPSGPKTAESN
jgi:NAD(P)-dependent dehydrogenase (short-subunit alcohol dehydrogenase family)